MTAIRPCPYPRCVGPDRNPTLTADGICHYCRPSVERNLREAPQRYIDLYQAQVPGGTGMSDKVSGTKVPALPLRLVMVEAGIAYAAVLSQWVNLVRLHGNMPPRTGRARHGWIVDSSARFLLPRSGEACRVSPESAVDLASTAAVAARLLTLSRLFHRLAAPCPDCDLLALYREDGASYIRCASCGSSWAEEPQESLARVIAEQDRLSS